MSNVTLAIGGRSYAVNCDPGEEDHVAELGAMIDSKLSALGQTGQNESRSLLFAALLLADEIYELRSGNIPETAPPPPSVAPEQLSAIADRLENLARHLEA
jgi:cell division protein ZapA